MRGDVTVRPTERAARRDEDASPSASERFWKDMYFVRKFGRVW